MTIDFENTKVLTLNRQQELTVANAIAERLLAMADEIHERSKNPPKIVVFDTTARLHEEATEMWPLLDTLLGDAAAASWRGVCDIVETTGWESYQDANLLPSQKRVKLRAKTWA
jgi:hypothetical protein